MRFIIAHEATAKRLIRRTGILSTHSSFKLKSTRYFRFAELIQPLRGCGTSVRCWPRVSPAVIDLQALRAFKPQLLRVTGISAGLVRLIWHCVQPHRGCDVVLLLPQRVSPAVIDIQPLRAFKPQLLRVTGISAGLVRLIWHCVQPHRRCDVVLLLPQRVSPTVIDINPFGLSMQF